MQLTNLTPDVDTSGIWLHIPEVNRPALQLTGFYNQFDNDRIQIIGNVEYSCIYAIFYNPHEDMLAIRWADEDCTLCENASEVYGFITFENGTEWRLKRA
mgnify:CR=1 FL=1|jgi:hypothetical protein